MNVIGFRSKRSTPDLIVQFRIAINDYKNRSIQSLTSEGSTQCPLCNERHNGLHYVRSCRVATKWMKDCKLKNDVEIRNLVNNALDPKKRNQIEFEFAWMWFWCVYITKNQVKHNNLPIANGHEFLRKMIRREEFRMLNTYKRVIRDDELRAKINKQCKIYHLTANLHDNYGAS